MRSRHSSSASDNSCCRVPPDALHAHLRACPPSLHGCLSGAMAALVSLACSLSGNTKLCGDLRRADPEVDGTVHDGVKLGLCRVARRQGALEPVKDLSRRSLGRPLRRAHGVHSLVLRLAGARLPRSLCRSAPRLAHAINDARLPTRRVSLPVAPKHAGGSRKARKRGSCAITSRSSAPHQMAACSVEYVAASFPPSPTGVRGLRHARQR
jgi:hypothetical protein